jgi:hypothetical protein
VSKPVESAEDFGARFIAHATNDDWVSVSQCCVDMIRERDAAIIAQAREGMYTREDMIHFALWCEGHRGFSQSHEEALAEYEGKRRE